MPATDKSHDESYKTFMDRIVLTMKPVEKTFMTLSEADQELWQTFFHDFIKVVLDDCMEKMIPPSPGNVERNAKAIYDSFAGAVASIWATSQEHYRLYGPLWK